MAEANGETILAACDEPVAGKTFEDEKARLAVSRQFYCGTLCDEAGLVEKMRTATIINLAGDRCVEVAIRYGFVGKGRIVRIGGIAHAQAITPKYSNVE
ncbi:MAG: DUF424 family protein [Candidatus Aenigmarchaeota archaeon]|nr:DUF424 family protein [Candidatus Aenigmarchaeota archaeon]